MDVFPSLFLPLSTSPAGRRGRHGLRVFAGGGGGRPAAGRLVRCGGQGEGGKQSRRSRLRLFQCVLKVLDEAFATEAKYSTNAIRCACSQPGAGRCMAGVLPRVAMGQHPPASPSRSSDACNSTLTRASGSVWARGPVTPFPGLQPTRIPLAHIHTSSPHSTLLLKRRCIFPLPQLVVMNLFHELPEAIRRRAASEFFRLLAPGGLLVLTDSVQAGDRLALDTVLPAFGDFNEPYYRCVGERGGEGRVAVMTGAGTCRGRGGRKVARRRW